MDDELLPHLSEPSTEPSPRLSLKQAAQLVGLSTKTLGEYLQSGKVQGRKARPRPNAPLQWLVTEEALVTAGLLPQDGTVELRNLSEAAPLVRSESFAEAVLGRVDAVLEALGTYAREAGRADGLAELLSKERQETHELMQKVSELQRDLAIAAEEREALASRVAQLESALTKERERRATFGEWFWGKRRSTT